MKTFSVILIFLSCICLLQAEAIKLHLDEGFDPQTLGDYKLSWKVKQDKLEFREVKLKNATNIVEINFGGDSRPEKLMLYKGEVYLCMLEMLGANVRIPPITKLSIDVTKLSGGTITFCAHDSDNGYGHAILENENPTYDIPANGSTYEIRFYRYGDKASKVIGSFSVDMNSKHHLTVSNDNDDKTININMALSLSKENIK